MLIDSYWCTRKRCMGLCSVYCGNVVWAYARCTVVLLFGLMLGLVWNYCMGLCSAVYSVGNCCMGCGTIIVRLILGLQWNCCMGLCARFTVEMLWYIKFNCMCLVLLRKCCINLYGLFAATIRSFTAISSIS